MSAQPLAAIPAIAAEALNLWYGNFHALIDVSFQFPAGEISALIGPSGCGKSSLLRCLNRIHHHSGQVRVSGTVETFGRNIYARNVAVEELRKLVGMVFQRPNPLPLTIRENVLFGYRLHRARGSWHRSEMDEHVEMSLRKVHLWEAVKDRLGDPALSLQLEAQQKLCIARLLPLKPKILLMDEPCSALDIDGTRAVEELLLELKGEYTILIVTHNLAQARRISQNAAFMLLGRLIECGTTAQIFQRPLRPETGQYIGGTFG